jgi:hypothetical protein
VTEAPAPATAATAMAGAEALLDAGPGRARARTVARLLRYALEQAVGDYWEAARPGEVGRRIDGRRLRLLAATLGTPAAHRVYALWCALSDAAKPHPYEHAPSVAELRALQTRTVKAVGDLVAAAPPTASQ